MPTWVQQVILFLVEIPTKEKVGTYFSFKKEKVGKRKPSYGYSKLSYS